MLVNGQAPKTKLFPHNWYNSLNIHFLSINDFEDLCREYDSRSSAATFGWRAARQGVLEPARPDQAVFLLMTRSPG